MNCPRCNNMLRGETIDGQKGERDQAASLGPYRAAPPLAEKPRLPEEVWVHRCGRCQGVWISAEELAEALQTLAIVNAPDLPAKLSYDRSGPAADCPRCMTDMTIRHSIAARVDYDFCGTCGGVWFDAGELRQFADPFVAMSALLGDIRRAPPPRPPAPQILMQPDIVALEFEITTPQGRRETVRAQREIIKIGRLASSHLRLDDEKAALLHAVIEIVDGEHARIIDLGSDAGTFVNDAHVSMHRLSDGDVIGIGDTKIKVGFVR